MNVNKVFFSAIDRIFNILHTHKMRLLHYYKAKANFYFVHIFRDFCFLHSVLFKSRWNLFLIFCFYSCCSVCIYMRFISVMVLSGLLEIVLKRLYHDRSWGDEDRSDTMKSNLNLGVLASLMRWISWGF